MMQFAGVLMIFIQTASAGLATECTVDAEDPLKRYCSTDFKCCAYVNDSIYDNGNEIYFCMTDNDYNYNILDDGSYSENNGQTKYYYLECEQVTVMPNGSNRLQLSMFNIMALLAIAFGSQVIFQI